MVSKCKPIPCRYIFATLACLGMIVCYSIKVNLNIAIVSMVNHTAIRMEERDSNNNSNQNVSRVKTRSFALISLRVEVEEDSALEDGPMLWSLQLQGIIISSYFWGYLIGQYPGGRLAEIFSAKWMFYIGATVNVVGCLLIPPAAYVHFGLVITIRIIQGLAGGFTFPSCHVLLSRWAPPNERSIISTIIYTGTAIGTVISLLMTGTIAANINWEAAFYIMGSACILWMVAWPFLVYDRPKLHPLIKEKELKYLTEVLGGDESKVPLIDLLYPMIGVLSVNYNLQKRLHVPWKSMIKSVPLHVLIIAHVTTGWTWYMVLTGLPLFMHMVLHFKLQENAILTATPFFSLWILSLFYSKLIDCLISRKKVSVTWARKISTIVSTVTPMICLIAMCYIGEQRVIAVILMTLSVTSIGAIFSGSMLNHIDLASNYAGTLMGITNTLATLGGIIVPIFVGWLTNIDPSINSWRIIFWITAGLNGLQLVTFVIFGTAKEQKWNKIENLMEADSEPKKE